MKRKTEELRKLKVYYKTAAPAHNFYRHQFAAAPTNVEYVASTPTLHFQSKEINPQVMPVKHNILKRAAIGALETVDIFEITKTPFVMPVTVPSDIDLIHSAQYILRTNKPWVVDFEEISVFAHYKQYIFSPRTKRMLAKMLMNDQCRKILPWTKAAQQGMFNLLKDQPEIKQLKEKTEVIYPTILPQPKFEKKDHDGVNLMFLGKLFYVKGALETIQAFVEARKENPNLSLRVISDIPADVREKYGKVEGLELIQAGKNLPTSYVEESYKWADVFTYPVHLDTLGFVIMEAMSYGLPVVSVDHFAVPELVENNVNGIVISNPYSDHKDFIKAYPPVPELEHPLIGQIRNPTPEYIEQLKEAILKVAENRQMREKMGKESRKIIEEGHLSVKHHAKELRGVYDEALK